MSDSDPKTVQYSNIQILIEGYPRFHAKAFKRTWKQTTESRYDGTDNKPFARLKGQEETTWEITEPADHAILHEVIQRCRNEGWTFLMTVLGKNKDGKWDILEYLYDCDVPENERGFGDHKAITNTFKGTAFDYEVENTELA